MTRERIEDFREIVLPFLSNVLLKTNYENLGKSDAEAFTRDFNEILELANKALEQEPQSFKWCADCREYDTEKQCCHRYSKVIRDAVAEIEQEPILDKINKMKSEIADSLEFWDYSPNNNPLARDMLETITNFWGDIKAESEG